MAGATFSFSVRQDWHGGFVGDFVIVNDGAETLSDWTVSFSADISIGDIWGADVTSRDGDSFTLAGRGWTETIRAGQTVEFGFVDSGAALQALEGLTLASPGTGAKMNAGRPGPEAAPVDAFVFAASSEGASENVPETEVDASAVGLVARALAGVIDIPWGEDVGLDAGEVHAGPSHRLRPPWG